MFLAGARCSCVGQRENGDSDESVRRRFERYVDVGSFGFPPFPTRTDRKKLTSSLTYRSPQHNDNDMVHQSISDSAEMLLLLLAPPT